VGARISDSCRARGDSLWEREGQSVLVCGGCQARMDEARPSNNDPLVHRVDQLGLRFRDFRIPP
jgi:hypothetical protein